MTEREHPSRDPGAATAEIADGGHRWPATPLVGSPELGSTSDSPMFLLEGLTRGPCAAAVSDAIRQLPGGASALTVDGAAPGPRDGDNRGLHQ